MRSWKRVQVELGEQAAFYVKLQAVPLTGAENLYSRMSSPKRLTHGVSYPGDLKLLMLTKNCSCFGSARSGWNRLPNGKASPSPVIPRNLLAAPACRRLQASQQSSFMQAVDSAQMCQPPPFVRVIFKQGDRGRPDNLQTIAVSLQCSPAQGWR